MERRGAYRIPSEDRLIAFESAARLGSFAHAAEELGTSRSTVSRLVASLERLTIEPVRKIADGSAPGIPGSRVAVATGRAAPVAELAERSARGTPVSPPVIEDREEIVRVTDSVRDLSRLCTRVLQPGHAG